MGLVGASRVVIVLNPADLSELPANVLLHLCPEILLLLLPNGQEVFVADRVGAIRGVRNAGVRVGPVDLELAEDARAGARFRVLRVLAQALAWRSGVPSSHQMGHPYPKLRQHLIRLDQ